MDTFLQESFFYLFFAGLIQAIAAIPFVSIAFLLARRRGPGSFLRLLSTYIVFNGFLLFWGCFGNFGFYSLTFRKLYFSADHTVDWFPFIPFGQWVLDVTLGDSHGYLIGDTTLWQLRWIWFAFAAPVWILTYFSTRWVLRVRGSYLRVASARALVCWAPFFLLAACSVPLRSADMIGKYSGATLHDRSPDGESLIEALEITEQGGVFQLTAFMDATNREDGMTQVSHTRSQWKGTGTMRADALAFTYTDAGEQGSGTLRRERTGLILTLDGTRYRLQRSPP